MPTLPLDLGNVVHEPVDGVVGVRGLVDGRGVLRAADGAIHDVVAFGAVLAADVLNDADVAAIDDDVDGVVIALKDWTEVRALRMRGELGGAVRSAREEDRARSAPLGTRMTVCSLTPSRMGIMTSRRSILEADGGGLEVSGRLAGVCSVLCDGGNGDGEQSSRQNEAAGRSVHAGPQKRNKMFRMSVL